jgi:hypothetical protein
MIRPSLFRMLMLVVLIVFTAIVTNRPAAGEQIDSRLILNATTYRFEAIPGISAPLRNGPTFYMGTDGTVIGTAETNAKFFVPALGDDERIGMLFHNAPGGGSTSLVLHDRITPPPGLGAAFLPQLEGLVNQPFVVASDGSFAFMLQTFDFGAGADSRVVYQGTSASVSPIAIEGSSLGGTVVSGFRDSLGSSRNYFAVDATTSSEKAIYLGAGASLTRAVGSADIGSIAGSAVTDLYFGDDPARPVGDASDDGKLIFRVVTADAKQHYYAQTGSGPQKVVSVGDVVTGNDVVAGQDSVSHLFYGRIGDGGHQLVTGRTSNIQTNDFLMYGTPGDMKVIAKETGTTGLPAGYSFAGNLPNGPAGSVIFDNGDMIFATDLDHTNSALDTNALIHYNFSSETFDLLVYEGMDPSDLGGANGFLTPQFTANAGSTNGFAINDRGDIVFAGTYEYDDPNNIGARLSTFGLFLLTTGGQLSLALEEGIDELDFGSGFELATSVGLPGGMGSTPRGKFNNNGDLLLSAESAAGQEAFFVVNVNSVPEPAAMALLIMGGAAIGVQRRARR